MLRSTWELIKANPGLLWMFGACCAIWIYNFICGHPRKSSRRAQSVTPTSRPSNNFATAFLRSFALAKIYLTDLSVSGRVAAVLLLPISFAVGFHMGSTIRLIYFGLCVVLCLMAKDQNKTWWFRGFAFLALLLNPFFPIKARAEVKAATILATALVFLISIRHLARIRPDPSEAE